MTDPRFIDHPYHFDRTGRTAETDRPDHVRDMIEQLLFTAPGERVNRPEFGSGLLQLVFAPNSSELAAAVQFSTEAAVQQWLGTVLQVENLAVRAEEATLNVVLTYSLRRTGEVQTETFVRGVG